jgi:antitoxin component YwqK of YwqJK toxin-antitoxin module
MVTNCNRFGYARLDDENDIIIKVKPISILASYVNGFVSDNFNVIESYDFFTKRQEKCSVPPSVCFYYNENNTYFDKSQDAFGQLTGKYESTDLDGGKIIRYLSNGQLHREGDRPAQIEYYKNGNKEYETWAVNNEIHREGDKPAQIEYYENGNKYHEKWLINGQHHREGDKPAQIKYYKNGNKECESWSVNDELHRDGDRPAKIEYYENGNKKYEEWWVNGRFYRNGDQPRGAYIGI